MEKNIGKTDSIIRIVVAIIISALFFTHTVTGIFGNILRIIGGLLLFTSVLSFSPLYALLRINTNKEK